MLTFLLSYGHDYLVAHSTLNGSMYNAFVHATKHYISNNMYIETAKNAEEGFWIIIPTNNVLCILYWNIGTL